MFSQTRVMSDAAGAVRSRRPWWRREPRLMLAAAGVAVLGVAGLASEVYGSSHTGERHVLVAPGDTVWGIAAGAYGPEDLREHVDAILSANNLPGGAVVPGQTLTLPAP